MPELADLVAILVFCVLPALFVGAALLIGLFGRRRRI